MADNVTQGLLLGLAAIAFLVATTVAFLRSLLSFRYWVGWLVLGVVLLVMSFVVAVVPREWDVLGLRFVDVAVAAFLFVILLVAVQLSISISGHRRMLTSVAQECAELRYRVEMLERESSDPTAPDRPDATG
jgi:hypothetical protein